MALTKIKTGSVSDSITLTTPDINGGTIDATLIGGTTPAAISGTTGTFSSTVRAVGTTLTSASSATLAFTGTTSRLESRGADVSTRGAIQLMQATSNGSNEIVALGFDAAGAATFNGNVGIGISAVNTTYGASHALQIASISDNNWSGTLILSSADGTSVFSRLAASTNGFDLINTKSTDMRFFTNNTLRMSITNVGNLLIGDNAQANGNNSTCTIQSGGTVAISRAATNAQNQMLFYNPNGAVGSIRTNGSATAFNTSSDYRLKENVVPMTGSIDRVKALNPSRFNFIADADTTVDGFLAHEVEAVVPEAISGSKDAMQDEEYEVTAAVEEVRDEDDNVTTEAAEAVMGTRSVPDMQGIDQSKLVPLLVAALQEAIARIEILEGA